MKNLEKYLIDFDTLKVGDKVWTIQEGNTEIKHLDGDSVYPIRTTNNGLYKKDGCYQTNDKSPSLFKSNPFESISEYPKLMEVSSYEDFSFSAKRVVILKENNLYIAWTHAETLEEAKNSIATGTWKYAREIQPEKKKTRLTMEDIAKLANIDVKDLEIVK